MSDHEIERKESDKDRHKLTNQIPFLPVSEHVRRKKLAFNEAKSRYEKILGHRTLNIILLCLHSCALNEIKEEMPRAHKNHNFINGIVAAAALIQSRNREREMHRCQFSRQSHCACACMRAWSVFLQDKNKLYH